MLAAILLLNVACVESTSVDNESITQTAVLELLKNSDASSVIIDVRTPKEYKGGHVPTAVNIPHQTILKDVSLLDAYKDKVMIFYCHSGARVGQVTRLLSQLEYSNIKHLEGDMRGWRSKSLPIEN